jgi:hypothetical protein
MKKVFNAALPISLSENTIKTAKKHDGAIVMEIDLKNDQGEKIGAISFTDRRPQSEESFNSGDLSRSIISVPAKIQIFETPSGRIEIIADQPDDQSDVISTLLLKEYTDIDRERILIVPNHAWTFPSSSVIKLPTLGIQAA